MAVGIVKPRSDESEYRKILLPNHVQVLLSSNPAAVKASAALTFDIPVPNDPALEAAALCLVAKILMLGTESVCRTISGQQHKIRS